MDVGRRVIGAAQAAFLLKQLETYIEEYNKP